MSLAGLFFIKESSVTPVSDPESDPTPASPLTIGSFSVSYFTNDHSVDRTFISGGWSGGTTPYTVTVNGSSVSENAYAGPGAGKSGWKYDSKGTGGSLYYDISGQGTYTIVVTDSTGTSVSTTVEHSTSSDDDGGN